MNDPYVYYILSIVGLILCPVSAALLKCFPYGEDYEAHDAAASVAGLWMFGIMYSILMVLISRDFYKVSLTTHEVVKYAYYWWFTPHIIGLLLVCSLRREMISKIVSFIGRLR